MNANSRPPKPGVRKNRYDYFACTLKHNSHGERCQGKTMSGAAAALTEQIRAIFEQSGQTYSSPRVYAELQAQGVGWSRRRVAGLDATPARRRAHTTQADGRQPSATNLLARDFTADAPNRKWVVDITGIWTDEGWLYLAGVLDLFSRRLVGWAMAAQISDELPGKRRLHKP